MSHDSIETYEHAGQTVHIMADEHDRESPREWDNLSNIIHFNQRDHWTGTERYSDHEGAFYDTYDREPNCPDDWVRYAKEQLGATVVLPLYHYTHGSMTVRVGEAGSNPFSCPWDSGPFGIVFDTPESLAMCGTPADRIAECLKGEVETWNRWLNGEVYGYIIETEDDDHADSCWGYYEEDYCKSEANSAAEHLAEKRVKQAAELDRMAGVWRE